MTYRNKKSKSDFSIPFLEKSVDIFFHKTMATFGQFLRGFSIHSVFEKQKFFVKMIYSWTFALKIFLFRLMYRRLFSRIIHWPIFMSAVSECAGNAYRSNSVKSVRILNNFSFKRFHFGYYTRTLKGHTHDNVANFVDSFGGRRVFFKNLPSYFGADSVISIMKFPVRNIVEKCGKFYHKQIGVFAGADMFGHIPNSHDMPPIVSRPFTFKFLFYLIGNFLNNFLLVWLHRIEKSAPAEFRKQNFLSIILYSGFYIGNYILRQLVYRKPTQIIAFVRFHNFRFAVPLGCLKKEINSLVSSARMCAARYSMHYMNHAYISFIDNYSRFFFCLAEHCRSRPFVAVYMTCRNAIISIFVPRIKSTQQQYFPVFNQEKMNRGYKFEILFFHNAWIKKFSSPKIKIWFEPMFFSGFFCGFERCGSQPAPSFRRAGSAFLVRRVRVELTRPLKTRDLQSPPAPYGTTCANFCWYSRIKPLIASNNFLSLYRT